MARRLSALFFTVSVLAACQCGGPIAGDDAGLGGGSAGGGPATGGGPTTDGGSTDDAGAGGGSVSTNDGGCGIAGALCQSNGACCSNQCRNGLCVDTTFCRAAGETCASPKDCCTSRCESGRCAAAQCVDVGQPCTDGAECCTRNCAASTCASPPGSTFQCKVQGQGCTANTECCSTLCQGGSCAPAYFCQANGDSCGRNSDCCGNACSVNDGGAGFCQFITGGGSGGWLQDGNPCPMGGENCASRTCVDVGTGAAVCVPATGCRTTSNFCSSTSACCGGAPNVPGTVTCDATTSRCALPTGCLPPGTVCGNARLPDGGIYDVNANVDCCTGTTPPVDASGALCRIDTTGVPRCFGGKSSQCPTGYTGTAPCCIGPGEACQFKDQCCNGAPCLPRSDGGAGFVCATGNACVPLGGFCGADGGASPCCPGTQCLGTELGSICLLPSTTTTDGGTNDAGAPSCKPNDQSCRASAECCSGTCAVGADGGLVCRASSTCSVSGGPCTASADCCTGLSCVIPGGSSSGSCQASSCQSAGQTCSSSLACCSGLQCLSSTGQPCGATGTCTCNVIIN